MNNLLKMIGIVLLGNITTMTSCKKKGCTDPNATNYSADAKKDDGSCILQNATGNNGNASTPSQVKAVFLANRTNNKETFTVDAKIPSQLVAAKGTKITIPENAFVTQTGAPVTGNVTIDVLEVLDQSSMIWYGLPTMSNGRTLNSGGQLMVKAYANGQELALANGIELDIELPSDNNQPEMTLYYGMETKNELGDVNWLLGSSLGYDDSISYDSIVYCDTIYYSYEDSSYLSAPLANNWQDDYPNIDTSSLDYILGNNDDTLGVYFFNGNIITEYDLDCNNQTQNPEEGYVFDFGSLGWINCDYLYFNAAGSGLDVITPEDYIGANTEIFLHFSNMNGVAALNYSGNNLFETQYDELPIGTQFTIVAISEVNGTYYSSFTPVTMTNNHSETLTMTATTAADIQNAINNL